MHPRQEIRLDEQAGLIRLIDTRLFEPTHRGFARRLLEALCDRPEVQRTEIDIDGCSCRVDFEPGSRSQEAMARSFADAVRAAAAPAEQAAWWKRPERWSILTGYRQASGVSVWETHPDEPGRVELRRAKPVINRDACSHVFSVLDGVEGCYVSPWTRRITVEFRAVDGQAASAGLDRLEKLLEGLEPAAGREITPAGAAQVATGYNRWAYLGLVGGALVMTVVGLIVPGIPTVPFLLATSYYLARSSPAMNERLHRAAFIGPILEEWEAHAALSPTSKRKLIGLTGVIIVVTLLLTPLSLFALFMIFIIGTLSVQGILKTPTLGEAAIAAAPRTRALPAA